jgi:S-DNA-T family DNA segregation ATPase FtsK/SpoIIIE
MKRSTKSSSTMQALTAALWRRLQEGGFILLTALAIFLLVSLITYNDQDPGWSRTAAQTLVANGAGRIGAWFSDIFLTFFGYLAYMFPSMIAYGGYRVFQNRNLVGHFNRWLWALRFLGFFSAVAAGCGLAAIHFNLWTEGLPYRAGGILGQVVIDLLIPAVGIWGGTLLLVAVFLTGITLATGLSWFGLMDWVGSESLAALLRLRDRFPVLFQHLKKFFAKWQAWALSSASASASSLNRNANVISLAPKEKRERLEPPLISDSNLFSDNISTSTSATKSRLSVSSSSAAQTSSSARTLTASREGSAAKETRTAQEANSKTSPSNSLRQSASALLSRITGQEKPEKNVKKNSLDQNPHLPEVNLLEPADEQTAQQSFSPQKLKALSQEVEARLLEFGVQVTVVAVYPGPVITRFELELAAGLKVSKITGLSKDLARALSVTRVRVVEVIPGKSVVGLEIPNEHRALVRFREIIESNQYRESTSVLSLALGKDIAGEPVVVNLTKMPHLLVAGTTGAGKSVGVNVMLLSILYKATPADVRLILIDPKMLELSIYDGIPHLLTPVVTDMKDAANVLRWCVAEMERRYQLMAALGVRNLIGYNRKIQDAEAEGRTLMNPLWRPEMGVEQPALERLPYIVVIIDEFADMIMVVGKKVEELIARIAQKARAAGIHLILATQRPSVDVITGLIKANVPTRIAYQVSSRIDSRTILDQQGAEQLLGHGDMLYLSPGAGIPTRIHGAFVSDEEVHAVVKAIKQTGEPDYAQDILGGSSFSSSSTSFGMGGMGGFDESADGEQDDLYDQAVQIVTESRRASISHLQRRLKVGYNRAARLIETMEAAGVVSQMQSNGGREVLAAGSAED